jgi:hypothetical protein
LPSADEVPRLHDEESAPASEVSAPRAASSPCAGEEPGRARKTGPARQDAAAGACARRRIARSAASISGCWKR